MWLSSWLLSFALSTVVVNAGLYKTSKVATAWYAEWHSDAGFPLLNVPWSKYTHLTYAFAETTPDVKALSLNDTHLLQLFVSKARSHNVKALVSIGGWTGSRFWSSNVGSAKNRTAFVKTVTTFAKKYQLDGLDFDWEYPVNPGIGCNVINTGDTANFLAFIQELRKDPIGSKLILSAATATVPFSGPDGVPMSSVAGFAQVLDWIAIMNYDLWGPWSPTVGPNAPLDDTCAAAENQVGSAVSAVKKWSNAGIPHNQIVLGVAAYGHSFLVHKEDAFVNGSQSSLKLYPAFDSTHPPSGDSWDDPAGVDECGAQQNPGGNVDFWGMIELGYLNKNGKPKPGIAYRFDECSQTPFAYNPATEIMVSYDDAQSFQAKGKFIKSKGLRGFAMWEAGGDSDNTLINAIRDSAGL